MIVKMKTRNLACLIAVTDNIKLYTYESTYKWLPENWAIAQIPPPPELREK